MIEPHTWKQRGFEIKFMGVGDDDNKIWLDYLLFQYLASEGKKTNSNNCRWEKSPQSFVSWPISLSGGLDFQIKGVSFLRWLICLFAKYKTLEEGINRFPVAEVNFSSRRHLTPNLPDTGSRAST